MKKRRRQIANLTRSNKSGLALFSGLAVLTFLILSAASGAKSLVNPPGLKGLMLPSGNISVNATLSQTKIVQDGDNKVYLDVAIATPAIGHVTGTVNPTDLVLVLDRSGSMSEPTKMPFAKAAIRDVLAQIGGTDRFALISFADGASIDVNLGPVTVGRREQLYGMVDSIRPGGGTNMGDGLSLALNILQGEPDNRARKVLLLSDGQANQGITNPQALAGFAQRISARESILSTIGMGLNFNETLMSSLADHGMGHYSYLENLAGLSQTLSKDLIDTRRVHASSSYLRVKPGKGVRLENAGGYPITIDASDSSVLQIASGQLLAGASKGLVLSFEVPTKEVSEISLGDIDLIYRVGGKQKLVSLAPEKLTVAVVEAARREEAISSVDETVYKKSWLKNNFGRLQDKVGYWLREGKKDQAEKAITEYRDSLGYAAAASPVSLGSEELDAELSEIEAKVEDAFHGDEKQQLAKRKRAAKSLQYEARSNQRVTK